MFKKALLFILIAVVLGLIFLPGYVDRTKNKIRQNPPYKVNAAASQLYRQLDFITDLHADSLLWQRNLLKENPQGDVDIPRLIKARVALQAFTIVSKTPAGLNFESNSADSDMITALFIAQLRPLRSWFDLTQRALVQAQALDNFARNSKGQFRVIHTQQQLGEYLNARKQNSKLSAGFLGIEGAQVLQGSMSNVDVLAEAGFRMIGLTHFFDNEVGGSAHGINKGGLTDFGRALIPELEQRSIIIDLAHAAPQLVDEVLAMAKRPLIVSHTGVKGTCDNQRNLSDEHLRKIAAGGGLVGISMFKQAVCGIDAMATAQAIVYTSELIGAEHVALGSDFDGAVTTPFDVTGLPLIVEALLDLGMPADDIHRVMGENAIKFLLQNLPAE